jgi:riboflavin kinase/FMN adenylyltransferase
VYAVRAKVNGDPWRDGVANLGARPTFDKGGFSIEVHLLDFRGDIYGSQVEVAFVERLRPERRFEDLVALQAQIREDVEHAHAVLAETA